MSFVCAYRDPWYLHFIPRILPRVVARLSRPGFKQVATQALKDGVPEKQRSQIDDDIWDEVHKNILTILRKIEKCVSSLFARKYAHL